MAIEFTLNKGVCSVTNTDTGKTWKYEINTGHLIGISGKVITGRRPYYVKDDLSRIAYDHKDYAFTQMLAQLLSDFDCWEWDYKKFFSFEKFWNLKPKFFSFNGYYESYNRFLRVADNDMKKVKAVFDYLDSKEQPYGTELLQCVLKEGLENWKVRDTMTEQEYAFYKNTPDKYKDICLWYLRKTDLFGYITRPNAVANLRYYNDLPRPYTLLFSERDLRNAMSTFWEWCNELGYKPEKTDFLFEYLKVKKLIDARFAAEEEERNRAKNEAIKAYQNKRNLHFDYEGYTIYVPESVQDYVQLGERMHNCVGTYGYDEKTSRGECNIVAVCAIGRADKPLVCVEINSRGLIRQYVAPHNNSVRDETLQTFKNEYQTYLNNMWIK